MEIRGVTARGETTREETGQNVSHSGTGMQMLNLWIDMNKNTLPPVLFVYH